MLFFRNLYYETVYFITVMPVRVEKISVAFEPHSEPDTCVTRKCHRCKQIKNSCCFKRVYIINKKHYNNCSVKYALTCSECLDKSVKQTVIQ